MRARVLVADDDPDVLDLIVTVLRRGAFEIHTAVDGLQALEMLRNDRFDVAVLDVLMPRLTGIEVVQLLTRDGAERPPVLLLTTQVMPESIEAAREAGVEDMLARPFHILDLVDRVQALANQSHMKRTQLSY